jgi:glycosyltransferase involved in cell wall biosynthesis
MKIVQTNKAYFPKIGGIETTTMNLSEGFMKQYDDVVVSVLSCNDKRSYRTVHNRINNVDITYLPTFGFISSLPICPSYGAVLQTMKADILHIHEPFPLADLSFILFPWVRKNFSKIVVSWHSDIVRQKWALWMYRPLLRRFLKKVDTILVSNPNLVEYSDFLSHYKDKCKVVPHGINLNWVEDRTSRIQHIEQIQSKHAHPLVLFVGRLVYYKGIQYLVDAMKQLPSASLVIIGSGPLEAKIKQQIIRYRLEKRITILPQLSEEELHSYYDACDVFVLPSIEKSEAYGLVQIEAMACGKPVISTELHTGTSYINQHGTTGFVVPPRDSMSIANAIRTLTEDESLRCLMGKNAKARAVQEFTTEKMVERTYDVYKKLLSVENGGELKP